MKSLKTTKGFFGKIWGFEAKIWRFGGLFLGFSLLFAAPAKQNQIFAAWVVALCERPSMAVSRDRRGLRELLEFRGGLRRDVLVEPNWSDVMIASGRDHEAAGRECPGRFPGLGPATATVAGDEIGQYLRPFVLVLAIVHGVHYIVQESECPHSDGATN